MDYIVKDTLAGEIIPVLLGVSTEVNETAHRMYREYGVVSHVFCEKIPLPMRLSMRCRILPISWEMPTSFFTSFPARRNTQI